MPTEAELLASINTQLAAAIANPKESYRIGDITYNHGGFLTQMISLRDSLLRTPTAEETIEPQAIEISPFGEDKSEVMV